MKLQNILLKTVLFLVPLAILVCAYSWSIHALSNYMFNQLVKPLVAQDQKL